MSTPTPPQRRRAARLPPAQRRAQLLQLAIAECAQRGISNARPLDVATAAGVSESTVFSYFKTRDDLIQSVLSEVVDFYMQNNQRFLSDESLPVPIAILELGAAFSASVDSHPHHARVWLDWSNSSGQNMFSQYLAYQESVERLIVAVLQRGLEQRAVAEDIIPADSARILYMAAQMVVQMKLTKKPASEVNRFLISATRAVIGRRLSSNEIPEPLLGDFSSDTRRTLGLVS